MAQGQGQGFGILHMSALICYRVYVMSEDRSDIVYVPSWVWVCVCTCTQLVFFARCGFSRWIGISYSWFVVGVGMRWDDGTMRRWDGSESQCIISRQSFFLSFLLATPTRFLTHLLTLETWYPNISSLPTFRLSCFSIASQTEILIIDRNCCNTLYLRSAFFLPLSTTSMIYTLIVL